MELPIGLPKAEEFEKIDRMSRRQWRLVVARTFIADMGGDVLREIVAAGLHEWRLQFFQIQQKHALRQEDADWIFRQFQNEVRRRDVLVHSVRASAN